MSHPPHTEDELLEAAIAKGRARGLSALNEAQRIVFVVADLDAEIPMNGLVGYYDNSSGQHAGAAVDALERLGAERSAALLREANALFPGGAPPVDWQQRRAALDSLEEAALKRMNELGELYLSRPDDLGDRFYAFLRDNWDALADRSREKEPMP